MQPLRGAPRLLTRSTRTLPRPSRRFASTEHEHGHGHEHAHHGPVEEPLGKGFYVVVAAIPLSLAVYKLSRSSASTDPSNPGSQPWFTRLINSYSVWMESWKARNSLHTAAIEQAAHDRHLFHSSRGSSTVPLKFPEIVNVGSPYNVPAGHGSANIDALVAHYEAKRAEEEDRKLKQLAQS